MLHPQINAGRAKIKINLRFQPYRAHNDMDFTK